MHFVGNRKQYEKWHKEREQQQIKTLKPLYW
jgi:hypothetical protein